MIIHDVLQGTTNWMALRAGLPTASEFSKLITSTGEPSKSLEGYAMTLAGELYAGQPLDQWEGNEYTERGKLLEEEARLAYAFHTDTEPETVGFVTDDAKRYGCSPDAFVGDDGMVEIKCLKAENHIKAILYFKKNSKCPPDFVQQTQGQLLVCERAWVDLYFYHPMLPKIIIRQSPDADLHNALKSAIERVLVRRDEVLSVIRESATT